MHNIEKEFKRTSKRLQVKKWIPAMGREEAARWKREGRAEATTKFR